MTSMLSFNPAFSPTSNAANIVTGVTGVLDLIERVSLPSGYTPIIHYDIGDADTVEIDEAGVDNANYANASQIDNKADVGTYDAEQTSNGSRPMVTADALNGHVALTNRGNGFMTTGYSPKDGDFTFGICATMPTTPNFRCLFGVTDNSNNDFYLATTSSGQIRFDIGLFSFTTTETYTAGDAVYVVVTGDQSDINVWVNGTQVFTDQTYSLSADLGLAMHFHGRNFKGSNSASFNTASIGSFVYYEDVLDATGIDGLNDYLEDKTADNLKHKVVIIAGQSNATGVNGDVDYTDADKEKLDFRIRQIGRTGDTADLSFPAVEPLKHASVDFTGSVGLGTPTAKAYLDTISDPYVRVLLVPVAQGTTGFDRGDWVVTTGARYLDTIAKANTALAKFTDNELLWMVWQQGEDDVGDMTEAQYATYFDDMMVGLRAGITGASSMIVTVGQAVPDKDMGVIGDAIDDVENRDSLAKLILNTGLTDTGDDLHYDGASTRTMGQRHFAGYQTLI